MQTLERPTIEALRAQGARVAGHAYLREIRTFSLSAELAREPAAGLGLAYEFEPVIEAHQPSVGVLIIDGFFRLSISEHEAENEDNDAPKEPEKDPLAEIKFNLSSFYTLRPFDDVEAEPFGAEELDAFAKSTGQFALYPYARALVSDLTGRLGLPGLTLPILTIDVTSELADGERR